jgi:hypothetical protein
MNLLLTILCEHDPVIFSMTTRKATVEQAKAIARTCLELLDKPYQIKIVDLNTGKQLFKKEIKS